MRAQELLTILNGRPFQPIRLYFTGGDHVDVRHPEMVLVERETIFVAFGPGPGRLVDRIAYYNLLHLIKATRITTTNGHNKRQRRRR